VDEKARSEQFLDEKYPFQTSEIISKKSFGFAHLQ